MSKKQLTEKNAVEALAALKDAPDNPIVRQSAQEAAAFILRQPAKTKSGEILVQDGRQLTQMDAALYKLLTKGDANSITTILSLAGVMQPSNELTDDEKKKRQEAKKKQNREVAKITNNIRRQYQRDEMYKSCLLPLIKHVAQLDYAVSSLEAKCDIETPTIKIVSREGNERIMLNPALKMLQQLRNDKAKAETTLLNYARKLKNDEPEEERETPLDRYIKTINNLLKDDDDAPRPNY